MTDTTAPFSWADLASQINAIDTAEALAPAAPAAPRFRVLVATDWSSATVPLVMVKAFSAMIPVDAPVDLVFALAHEPGEEDVECVHAVLGGLPEGAQVAGLVLESFADAATKNCYAAVIPSGDPDDLLTQVAATLTTLHQLSLLVTDADRFAAEPAPVDAPNPALARRLAAFAEPAR